MKNPRQPKGSGEYSNPKLAVQMLVKQTDWLDGELHWVSNRVGWIRDGTTVIPEQKDLAKAQRRLYKIAEFPNASKKIFGDPEKWLRCRQQRLELAKTLVALDCSTLKARRGNKKLTDAEVERFSALIVAEALCANLPQCSPAESVSRLGQESLPVLLRLLKDRNAPEAARALAAMVAGAMKHDQLDINLPAGSSPWMQRAFAVGRKLGMTDNTSTLMWFLTGHDSEPLLARVHKLLAKPGQFFPEFQDCRYLLVSGTAPAEVVQILERLRDIENLDRFIPSSKDLANQRPPSPKEVRERERSLRKRGYVRRQTAPMRQTILQTLGSICRQYALRTRKSQVVDLVEGYVRKTVALDEGCLELLEMLILSLERGLTLSPELSWHYIRMLHDYQERFWTNWIFVFDGYKEHKELVLKRLGWLHGLAAFGDLLAHSQDADWVESLLERDVIGSLSHCCKEFMPDKQEVELALSLNTKASLNECSSRAKLISLVHSWGSVERSRSALLPFAKEIGALPADYRDKVFDVLSESICRADPSRAASLRAAMIMLPALRRCEQRGISTSNVRDWLFAQVAKFSETPIHKKFIAWSINYFLDHWENLNRFEDAIEVPIRLADGDFKLFQSILSFWCREKFASSRLVSEGLEVLENHPTLRGHVARAISDRLQLCLRLFRQLILLERFSIDQNGVLDVLTFGDPEEKEPWLTMAALLPDRKNEVASIYRAAKVLGLKRLPSELQDPIDKPLKMARELEYLQSRWQTREVPPNISIRIERLTDWLASPEKLNAHIRENLNRHIEKVCAELNVQAASHILDQHIKQRLGTTSGVAAESVDLTDHLLEAASLCLTLRVNRRLLRKLLKEILCGNRHWVRTHPSNERVLETMSHGGINVETWLSEFPRVFKNEDVPAGQIRLYLEQDPLLIMQMGNYFGTCLSLDSFNAFSTVANACDLNKRVLYATDNDGTVIARKLIAITTDLKLVGFRTYISMPSSNAREVVYDAVRRYCVDFASACRLPLADSGEVSKLVASEWYDDGIRQWGFSPDKAEPVDPGLCQSSARSRR